MDKKEIETYVVALMQKKYTLKKVDDLYSFNYVESGYVDSIELLQFLVEIEDHFDFEFDDDELSSNSIHTVGGLIEIICSKLQEK